MKILTLQDVNYHYPGAKKCVLHSLNVTFEMGTLYGIMGKSGAGKSTLLSLLAGLDLPTDGSVIYNDNDLRKLDRDDYRSKSIGVVFQSYNLLTNATAVDNIELSMNISKVNIKHKKKVAYSLLKKVGIDEETSNRKILKLSGGEQQRVGIARAIAHDPDIIIADEPTGNLDNDTENSILNELRYLASEQGKCVIIVTHSHKAASYCDVMYQLDKGRLKLK